MSLVALLALSSHPAAAPSPSSDPHAQQRRRLSFRRRNSLLKVYGPNKKSRYRSLLAGFSVDGLLALDAASASTSSRTRGAAMSLPVLLTAKSSLYVSPQSTLSAIVGSLNLWPAAAAWRRKTKQPSPEQQKEVNSSSQALVSAAGSGRPPLPAQLTRRRSQSRSSRDDPKASMRVQMRPRRSSKSSSRPPLPPSSRPMQSQLQRAAAQAANAQLSSELMTQKLESHDNNRTSRDDDEISYEMDEEELANRFYGEIKSAETHKSSAPQSPDEEPELGAREREWRSKRLALERQVAALLAENQTKSALIGYLMDENSRLVGDCECGAATAARDAADANPRGPGNNHDDAYASNGRAHKRACESPEDDSNDSFAAELTGTELRLRQNDPPASPVVHAAKWKLRHTDDESCKHGVYGQLPPTPRRRGSFVSMAANEAEFEGLVRELEAEFTELFAFASH